MKGRKDNPGVIAPPPLIFLCGLLIGGLASWFYPQTFVPEITRWVPGGFLVFAGLWIVLIARSKMAKAETNIEPWKPTTAILSEGVYGISRNPIYLAMVLIYVGLAILLNLIWILPPIILVLLVLHYGVILREEKYLEQKFGDQYRAYKKKVRRWI